MAERRWWRRRSAWWTLPLPALASSAAWITQVWFSESLSGVTRFSLVTIGVLASALTVLLPALELRHERGRIAAAEGVATEALAAYKVQVHDMLIPLAMAVTDVTTASTAGGRREARQSLRQLAVDLVAEYIGPERSRSCLYSLEHDPETGERTLRLRSWHGRNKQPRASWDPANPADAQVYALMDSLDAVLITDIGQLHLIGKSSTAEYRTFVCVAIHAGDRPLGILTLDSLRPGDLTAEDLDMVRLFAQMIATGLSPG